MDECNSLLIGIGETREERLDALFAIRDSHRRHGHVQEVIVQNFRAKQDTRMRVGHMSIRSGDHIDIAVFAQVTVSTYVCMGRWPYRQICVW